MAESAVSIRLVSRPFELACHPFETILNRFSGVLATTTYIIKLSTKFILTQKFFCYKCYISIDMFFALNHNRKGNRERSYTMKISSISQEHANLRKNMFINYSNSFMSMMNDGEKAVEKAQKANMPAEKADKSMGLEILTIFPKEVKDGKTIITA